MAKGLKQLSKSRLAIVLSKLEQFKQPKLLDEQYATDPEVAAEVLWHAHLMGDLKDKVSADLGSGTGMLGIGLLLLGAKKGYFVERDEKATEVARKNLGRLKEEHSCELGEAEFRNHGVEKFSDKVELIFQNPPFGTKVRHSDRGFLEKAFELAEIVYTFHKSESSGFVNALAADHGFRVTHRWDFDFPLKRTQKFHRRRIYRTKVSCYRIGRIQGGQ